MTTAAQWREWKHNEVTKELMEMLDLEIEDAKNRLIGLGGSDAEPALLAQYCAQAGGANRLRSIVWSFVEAKCSEGDNV